ncbi:MAG: hypothetical protein A4E67_02320 [Syntrophaceae bacterium PtaB.Bin038]|nr:MAG: hypothetical protein A4E67_02320 [Syntrophaceae bacterium PtaB.Bin038]
MKQPVWKFRPMSRGEINVDPIEGEFFSTEILGSLSDAVVREAIQNSLDAGLPGQPVRLAVTFPSADRKPPADAAARYLSGLRDHLEAKGSGLANGVDFERPMDFLLIEDFGTRGLAGDIRDDGNQDETAAKNDFYYFWRNIGRAVEGTTTRGRWGLGKTVFQAASRINSFFGLTVRQGEARRLLMGQSVLKIHRVNGRRYAPYGYYGRFEDDFALPVEDPEQIDRFCSDFSVRRALEPGLSVMIPYPDEEIGIESVIRSVIHQYFFPILSGDLVVTVSGGAHEQVLDGGNLCDYIESTGWQDRRALVRRLEFAKWCLAQPESALEVLGEPSPGRAPKWDEALFEPGQLDRLRRRFDAGERLAFRMPLWVEPRKKAVEHSHFRLFLERDAQLDRGEDFFIRDGITVTGVSSQRQKGMRVIVAVSDRPLSKLLGDSENPAHTEWQERSPKFKNRYTLGPACLRYVKNSPREVIRILTTPADGRDPKLLRDLFYVDLEPEQGAAAGRKSPKDGPGAGPADGAGAAAGAPPRLLLGRVKGGFRLSLHPEAKTYPRVIDLEMAYDVRQGNPFRLYRPYDFDLGKPPIRIEGVALTWRVTQPNGLKVTTEQPDFQLTVTGFDGNRDLKIRILTAQDKIP